VKAKQVGKARQCKQARQGIKVYLFDRQTFNHTAHATACHRRMGLLTEMAYLNRQPLCDSPLPIACPSNFIRHVACRVAGAVKMSSAELFYLRHLRSCAAAARGSRGGAVSTSKTICYYDFLNRILQAILTILKLYPFLLWLLQSWGKANGRVSHSVSQLLSPSIGQSVSQSESRRGLCTMSPVPAATRGSLGRQRWLWGVVAQCLPARCFRHVPMRSWIRHGKATGESSLPEVRALLFVTVFTCRGCGCAGSCLHF